MKTTRFYLGLPDDIIKRLDKYTESLPFEIKQNSLFVKAIDEFLKGKGF